MENQETSSATTLSLGNRIMNVFAAPSEAFEGIAGSTSKTALWLLPWIVSLVLGVIFTFVIFSNEPLREQIQDAQMRELQQRVEDGRMTQQQADQAEQSLSQMGGFIMIIAIISVAVIVSLYFFAGALVFWLVGKFGFKSAEGYSTFLALYGTAAWIGVLGSIVTMLMIVGLGSLYATPSAALAVFSDFDVTNATHRILGKLDIFAAWQAAIIGIGLGKVANKPLGTAVGVSVVLWIGWVLITGGLGLGT